MKRTVVVVSALAAVLAVGLFALLDVVAAPGGGAAGEGRPVAGLTRSVPDDATIADRFDGSAPVTWVFVGDSITHGSSHTHGRRSFAEHFAERTRTELGRVDDVVVNTGISGNRTADVLAGFDTRVRRFHPDVVVVMLGTNDSVDGPDGRDEFRARLSRIVSRVRDLGAVPVLQTPPPAYPAGARGHDDLGAYVDLVRDVAGSHDVVLVDHYARWLAAGDGGPPQAWLDDPIHPNGLGHLEMARTIFRRLHVFDPHSPTGGAQW